MTTLNEEGSAALLESLKDVASPEEMRRRKEAARALVADMMRAKGVGMGTIDKNIIAQMEDAYSSGHRLRIVEDATGLDTNITNAIMHLYDAGRMHGVRGIVSLLKRNEELIGDNKELRGKIAIRRRDDAEANTPLGCLPAGDARVLVRALEGLIRDRERQAADSAHLTESNAARWLLVSEIVRARLLIDVIDRGGSLCTPRDFMTVSEPAEWHLAPGTRLEDIHVLDGGGLAIHHKGGVERPGPGLYVITVDELGFAAVERVSAG